jgi:hypothetical protein
MDRALFKPISGLAEMFLRRNTYPTVTPRAINTTVTASSGTYNQVTEGLSLYPGYDTVDIAFQASQNKTDSMALKLQEQVTSVVKKAEYDVFNGTGTIDMLGINARLAGTSQEVAIAANGLDISGSASDAEKGFLGLDEIIDLCFGPRAQKILYMNSRTLRKYTSASRQVNAVINDNTDAIGNQILTYGGIPIIVMENDTNNNPILSITETQGTSSDCSSVYCVRWSIDDGFCLLTQQAPNNPDGMRIDYDMNSWIPGNSFNGEVKVQGYFGQKMGRPDCVARLTGLR